MTETVLAALRRALPQVPVLTAPVDTAPYLRDWFGDATGQCLAVLRPATTEEVAATVRACGALGLGIVPQGGNTGLVRGGLPTDPDRHVVLSLDRMRRIRSLDPDDFAVTVDAGCVLQEIKDAVAAQGLFLPLSLGAQGSCRIGGNVSTNAGGINVLRWGMARAQVLGLEVVLPDGRIWSRLGPLRKDNRGIDLKQLFIGAEGILGVVTGVTLALVPRPERVETALLALGSLGDAVTLFRRARTDCADLLSAFEFMGPEAFGLARLAHPDLPLPLADTYSVYILAELSCTGPVDLGDLLAGFLEGAMEEGLVLDGVIAASGSQAADLWRIREGLVEGQGRRGRHFRSDVSLPLSAVPDFVEAARRRIGEAWPEAEPVAYGHLGDGNVHLNALARGPLGSGLPDRAMAGIGEILAEEVARRGGSFSAEHGIGRSKRAALATDLPAEAQDLLAALKRVLDPQGIMNPDCMVPSQGHQAP